MSSFSRIAQIAVLPVLIGTALVGVTLFALAEAPPPATIEIDRPPQPTFTIGPIEGLTTTWHWAPRATSIPLGTIAQRLLLLDRRPRVDQVPGLIELFDVPGE